MQYHKFLTASFQSFKAVYILYTIEELNNLIQNHHRLVICIFQIMFEIIFEQTGILSWHIFLNLFFKYYLFFSVTVFAVWILFFAILFRKITREMRSMVIQG